MGTYDDFIAGNVSRRMFHIAYRCRKFFSTCQGPARAKLNARVCFSRSSPMGARGAGDPARSAACQRVEAFIGKSDRNGRF
jgi:hypothetical protein